MGGICWSLYKTVDWHVVSFFVLMANASLPMTQYFQSSIRICSIFPCCGMGRHHCTTLQFPVLSSFQLAGGMAQLPTACALLRAGSVTATVFGCVSEEGKGQCRGMRKEKREKVGSCQSKGMTEKPARTLEERRRERSCQKESSLVFILFLSFFFFFHQCFSSLSSPAASHPLLLPPWPPFPPSLWSSSPVSVPERGSFWVQKLMFHPPGWQQAELSRDEISEHSCYLYKQSLTHLWAVVFCKKRHSVAQINERKRELNKTAHLRQPCKWNITYGLDRN